MDAEEATEATPPEPELPPTPSPYVYAHGIHSPEPEPPPAPTVAAQVFVSKEDLLVSENMHLKAILMGREIEDIHQQIQRKMAEHQAMEAQLRGRRAELETKYGINLLTHYIRETDGLVLPRPLQGGLPGIMGQQIQPPPPGTNGVG